MSAFSIQSGSCIAMWRGPPRLQQDERVSLPVETRVEREQPRRAEQRCPTIMLSVVVIWAYGH
eukprot:7388093-Prymnesium_polylepis.2